MAYSFDLGSWSRPVSSSVEAQRWFDRGLNWLYGYNHEEAVACFKSALSIDSHCAMAWWGVAYASGPFYNRPWVRYSDAEIRHTLPVCYEAAQSARVLAPGANQADKAMIEAIALRYQAPEVTDRSDLDCWHREFTAAMRTVHASHPKDLDVATIFAEAAITCTPRLLWDLHSGEPNPDAYTHEALAALEQGMRHMAQSATMHPGLPHMLIHALEMSPFPERALRAADMLRGYGPDLGHLEHMPAHIYVLCGDYAQAVEQSRRAVIADDRYLAYAGADNFYSTARCHDFHLYMYAAMFLGQYRTALQAADRICANATDALIETSAPYMASLLDGYSAMRTHVLVRFGQWGALATQPAPARPTLTPIRFAMHAYGKGVGHANLGQFEQAELAQRAFQAALTNFDPESIFLSNPVVNVLAVGEAMLTGELAYHQGDFDKAFAALRLAVTRDDGLNYTEPWAWMHPPRHALGALLLEQNQFEEAEAVYRADLGYDVGVNKQVPRCCSHPDNIWALHGLLECVTRSGDPREAQLLRQRLDIAQARTDVQITASCCCRKR